MARPLCLLVLAGLLLSGPLGGCGGSGAPVIEAPAVPDAPTIPDIPTPPVLEPFPLFVDVTATAGIAATHSISGDYLITGQTWGDYDGDGWLDLYVTSGIGDNVLYKNTGEGTFEISALSSDVSLSDAASGGAVFVDYDNDGWRDLYVLNDGANTLFRNIGGTAFLDVTNLAGVGNADRGETASWGDYDGDGWLDLYVANWGFTPNTPPSPDGYLVAGDRLYHNAGDGTFSDVSHLLGELERSGVGFVASFLDFDNDGDLDIYLVNDKGTPGDPRPLGPINRNVLWRNDGAGPSEWVFTECAIEEGADARVAGMGLAIGDYDNDLDLDMYFSNIGPMVLLENVGGETSFRDSAPDAGVTTEGVGWGAVFGDFDLDGWLDLFLSKSMGPSALFLNAQDGTFEDVSAKGLPPETEFTIGVAQADYDRDGWLDLVVGAWGEGYRLYRNRGGESGRAHGWLSVRLTGGGPVNRDAVGSRVYVTRSDGLIMLREVVCGSSVGSGSDLALYFGLGAADVTAVRVVWPDGKEDTFTEVTRNAELALTY